MSTFIQLPPASGPPEPDINYRHGFERWARHLGSPAQDAVIIYTLDAAEVDGLREIWRGWAYADVRLTHACINGSHDARAHVYLATREGVRSVSLDAFDAARWNPAEAPTCVSIPCESLVAVVSEYSAKGAEVHLSIDLRVTEQRHVTSLTTGLTEVSAVVADVPDATIRAIVDELRQAGLRPAGRPFGIAGSSVAMRRPTSPRSWLAGALGQARVRGGVAIERWRARTRRIDPSAVPPLDQVKRAEVEDIVARVRRNSDVTWSVAVSDEDIDALADEAHDRFGVWPISFSYPAMLPLVSPVQQLSPIIPGFPYAFTDNAAYLSAYARASMALTFRKAGWDCFRHVEILASGAVPLMPDADRIPRYAMIHYPRSAMSALAVHAITHGGVPDEQTRRDFRAFAERHLTTKAMARYLLAVSGLAGSQRVLFIDDQTPVNPEYQSTLALIGLKQLLGRGCEVAFPADFLYIGSSQTAARHYGRGFGYSHAVDPDARTAAEESNRKAHGLEVLRSYDAVIVGSISRNTALTRVVLEKCDPSRVVLIHGEDGPPTLDELAALRVTGANVFVRALHPTR